MQATGLDAPPVSYEEYLTWPETNVPCEFVDGRPIMSPSPSLRHQIAVRRLCSILQEAAPAGVEVVPSPIDWVLRRIPLRVRQPDVAVMTAEQAAGERLSQPPLLTVEVVSPTSRERDLVAKRAEYAAAGLGWYWLVGLDVPQVVVLRNSAGVFVQHVSATADDRLRVDEPFPVKLRPADLVD